MSRTPSAAPVQRPARRVAVRRIAAVAAVLVALCATVLVTLAPANAATRPSAPRSVAGTSLHEAVRLTWAAPSTNGGAAITDYVVRYRRADTTTWSQFLDSTSTARSTTITGLANGRKYQFRVAARNRIGLSAFSTTITRTPAAKPGAPRDLVAVPTLNATDLQWNPPLSNGGSPITGYLVQYKLDTAGTWTTYGTITGTQANVPTGEGNYTLRVSARNLAGAGPFATVNRPMDEDGDGSWPPDDCNDSDASIFPGGVEFEDGLDNNCNGIVDEGYDLDQDGFTVGEGDCNDDNAEVFPGAVEIVGNEIDDDCDGQIDEE